MLEELMTLTQILQGSWVERYSVCSKKNCKCHKGEKHGPRYYIVVNENGIQRQKYVPLSLVDAALKGISQYHRLKEIVERITHINLQLIKETKYGD